MSLVQKRPRLWMGLRCTTVRGSARNRSYILCVCVCVCVCVSAALLFVVPPATVRTSCMRSCVCVCVCVCVRPTARGSARNRSYILRMCV
jgi:hypothetical protein